MGLRLERKGQKGAGQFMYGMVWYSYLSSENPESRTEQRECSFSFVVLSVVVLVCQDILVVAKRIEGREGRR